MNTVKKIIALITVVIIIIHTLSLQTFALAGAPVIAAEELTTLLETVLIGSGLYTESELEGKSYLELNDFLRDGINSGQIDPKKEMIYYRTPGEQLKFSIMEALIDPEFQAEIGAKNASIAKVSNNALSYWLNYMIESGGDLYDFINPTYNTSIDMQGRGGVYRIPYAYGNVQGKVDSYKVYLFDYAEVLEKSDGVYYNLVNAREYVYHLDGTLWYEGSYASNFTFAGLKSGEERYGDWRYADGTKADTDDEVIPVIGEADGTQVTPDMLNSDGTVTIDGTTYSPSDYIDWEKFKDPAIIDLLKQILDKIDSTPVAEPDTTKDLVDSITDSIAVPEELSDYMVPTGISSVFPFCLPFDLYRGVKLLSAPAVAPVLKIPFEVPEFGLFKGYKTELTIEFEKYDKYFSVFRWGVYFIFALSLVFISTKIVKGAGA